MPQVAIPLQVYGLPLINNKNFTLFVLFFYGKDKQGT